jgi:enoyl-CoA hydratase
MDLVLSGRLMDAAEAERSGLVSRIVPADRLMAEALALGEVICALGEASVLAAKESVNRSYEAPLSDGILTERRLFHAMFGTPDQKEGMEAFLAKRKPVFKR